jgi:carboxymethylenebutenolidase
VKKGEEQPSAQGRKEVAAGGQQGVSRREFTALSVATGLAVASGTTLGATGHEVVDTPVQIKTPDGTCDAALVHPKGKGSWPGVILFPDAFGLRPVLRDMAKRLAADGYTVVVPNQFYRSMKVPPSGVSLNFQSKDDMAKFAQLRAPLTQEAVMRDGTAFVAYLDSQHVVDRKRKIGVVGYCMGGPMTLQTAAAVPGRVGAGASFHGGGLVTDKPDSPHLLVPKIKARYYFGIAGSDDAKQPDAKVELQKAFGAAKLPAKIEVYTGTLHGWCIKDMPVQADKPIYDEAQAERAWGELTHLYQHALV